ncbi:hypothetical protein BGZ61DRAFT_529436 [Ilyonectria robusta]|uniref:uncharacterized protein n=1 Tax=Ilyonectria robusta TaxID=1079257 RepID=UPI001E8DC148|nr:uncharacterized protein BGZ61DRAFT_529436 [Ilyonectria robusta]KAH8729189.1 hypothetical protein BGZ61DRAFT_529436 [Ilyonectria robusta]
MGDDLCKLTRAQLESILGFTANQMTPLDPATERFYYDFKPVPHDPSARLGREWRELERAKKPHHRKPKTSLDLPKVGESLTIGYEGNGVVITREDSVGFFAYSVDINFNGGLFLPLLFTEIEAKWVLTNAKFRSFEIPHNDSPFLRLPRELRDKIYSFALPQKDLGIHPYRAFRRLVFLASVGDPSGFFFKLGDEPGILKVSRQIRQEALPFAYRNTHFYLDDVDDVVKFLVAIGHVGRSNITSLQFPWESLNDVWAKEEQLAYGNVSDPVLPFLHPLRCVQLLKECPRLRFLQISFDPCVFEYKSVDEFMADPGIASLSTLRGIRTLKMMEVAEANDETTKPLDEQPAFKWLLEEMGKAKE